MQIDPSSAAHALTQLTDTRPVVRQEIDVAVARKVLDVAEASTLTLLQSLQPHLGQHVDVSA